MGNQEYESEEGGLAVQDSRPELKEPPFYGVVLHNDDYTTMEFVIEVLRKYFHKRNEEAMQIMLKVHEQGKAIAGLYHLEIAETKVVQVHEYARAHGFPLKCSIEPTE
jgi:ATP-dependent Clp protease adaptor protein ClpS